MTAIRAERLCAEIEGDFVVFLIGMRLNKPWKVWQWAPVSRAMPRMLAELARKPELGLLHAWSSFSYPVATVIQYWRSFDHLEAYARDATAEHLPAWRAFNRAVASNGDVGIWHETFLVKAGQFEAVYNNMPVFGLGAAGRVVPAVGARAEARARIRGEITAG
jgi:Domain of unknown function (DUF4188)